MSHLIPVPAWVLIVGAALLALRELFALKRDEAMRDLWRMYLAERDRIEVIDKPANL